MGVYFAGPFHATQGSNALGESLCCTLLLAMAAAPLGVVLPDVGVKLSSWVLPPTAHVPLGENPVHLIDKRQ